MLVNLWCNQSSSVFFSAIEDNQRYWRWMFLIKSALYYLEILHARWDRPDLQAVEVYFIFGGGSIWRCGRASIFTLLIIYYIFCNIVSEQRMLLKRRGCITFCSATFWGKDLAKFSPCKDMSDNICGHKLRFISTFSSSDRPPSPFSIFSPSS